MKIFYLLNIGAWLFKYMYFVGSKIIPWFSGGLYQYLENVHLFKGSMRRVLIA